jgi:hypothetical protein
MGPYECCCVEVINLIFTPLNYVKVPEAIENGDEHWKKGNLRTKIPLCSRLDVVADRKTISPFLFDLIDFNLEL